jgi:hypothetical protein
MVNINTIVTAKIDHIKKKASQNKRTYKKCFACSFFECILTKFAHKLEIGN